MVGRSSSEEDPGKASTPASKSWASIIDNSPSVITFNRETECNNGEISVSIPAEITENAPPLWKNFVLGHFLGPAPHIGKVHAIVNKIWTEEGKKSKVDVNFLNSSTVLFKIDDDVFRRKVLKRSFWHIAEVPIVVQEWSPENANKKLDLTSISLWVDLMNIHGHLFSIKGISYIASVIGKPIRLHANTKRCTRLDMARVLIEVDFTKPIHNHILISEASGGRKIPISYPSLPLRCSVCSKWRHDKKACSSAPLVLSNTAPSTSNESPILEPEAEHTVSSLVTEPCVNDQPTAKVVQQPAKAAQQSAYALPSDPESTVTQQSHPSLPEVETYSFQTHVQSDTLKVTNGEDTTSTTSKPLPDNQGEWQVVHRDQRRSPRSSPPAASHQAPSPTRFTILA